MIKIMFVCHGNICRSPLAELVARKYIIEHNLTNRYEVVSKATSTEEIGNDLYPPIKNLCRKYDIPFTRHYASQVKRADYEMYDYFFCMDRFNVRNLMRIFTDDDENKIRLLGEFSGVCDEIEDPWYTDNFEKVHDQINRAITKIFKEELLK